METVRTKKEKMKASISTDGKLFVTSENQTESYALFKFYNDNMHGSKLSGENIFLDWSMVQEHKRVECCVCNGSGKCLSASTTGGYLFCSNCSGTGYVWI